MTTLNKDHILIFPFMAKGHTIPLINLTHSLLNLSLRVTFITTPINLPFILSSLPPPSSALQVITLPFPTSPLLPPSCQSTDHLPSPDLFPAFFHLTTLLRRPFHDLLQNLSSSGDLPLCVVADYFVGWTHDACAEFNLPRLVFHCISTFSIAVGDALCIHKPYEGCADSAFAVPGAPESLRLTRDDVPRILVEWDSEDDPIVQFLKEVGARDFEGCWGVVVNSFVALEGDYVGLEESFYKAGQKVWLVGPLLQCGQPDNDTNSGPDEARVSEWLDGKPNGSVIFVSFGTMTHVSDGQLDEIAHGLEMSGYDFLWAVRSATWAQPDGLERGKGFVARGWINQRRILNHRAMGGFMTHCGWNSVLESLSAGLPMLAWPVMWEQQLNAKFVVDEARAGLRIPTGPADVDVGIVGRAVIAKGVEELMGGEKGKTARERARELGEAGKRAVQPGGTSYTCLTELIDELRRDSGRVSEAAEA